MSSFDPGKARYTRRNSIEIKMTRAIVVREKNCEEIQENSTVLGNGDFSVTPHFW